MADFWWQEFEAAPVGRRARRWRRRVRKASWFVALALLSAAMTWVVLSRSSSAPPGF
jgi:hypothetical protein